MKKIIIQVNINEEGINSVVKTFGFEDNTSRHLEVAGALFNLANQELAKLGTTKSREVER